MLEDMSLNTYTHVSLCMVAHMSIRTPINISILTTILCSRCTCHTSSQLVVQFLRSCLACRRHVHGWIHGHVPMHRHVSGHVYGRVYRNVYGHVHGHVHFCIDMCGHMSMDTSMDFVAIHIEAYIVMAYIGYGPYSYTSLPFMSSSSRLSESENVLPVRGPHCTAEMVITNIAMGSHIAQGAILHGRPYCTGDRIV